MIVLVAMIVGITSYNNRFTEEEIEDGFPPLGYALDGKTLQVIEDVREMETILVSNFGLSETEVLNNATMGILRSKRYGYRAGGMEGVIWDTYAGSLLDETGIDPSAINEDFENLLRIADGITDISSPDDGANIDFVHMVAVMDVEYTDIDEKDYLEKYMDVFLSWGGDLETFLIDMMTYASKSGDSDYDSLYDYAYELMGGAPQSYFSQEDFLADIDGYNIQNLMKDQDLLLSEALELYYGQGGFTIRELTFIDNHGGEEAFEILVNAFMFGEVPDSYVGNAEYEGHLSSVQSFKRMMMVMGYDQGTEPSDSIRMAATDAFLNKLR